jgi:hypothetical protein
MTTTQTTRELFRTAFGAARVARRMETDALEAGVRLMTPAPPSSLAAGLDATRHLSQHPGRWALVTAAARAADMTRRLRLRRDDVVLQSSALVMAVLNQHARNAGGAR